MEELFGGKIQPACEHCEYAYPSAEEEMRLCMKKGLVRANFACRAFRYDPIMRIPRPPLEIETFEAADFAL